MPSRRAFLAGLAASSATPRFAWADVGRPVALSAARDAAGQFVLVGLRGDGAITFRVPLPARGHAAAAHPHLAEAVAIARRPGTFATVIDCATGTVVQRLAAPTGHHFYGHGTFSADGAHLFTTENHIASGQGRVGVWDRSLGYRRVGEFATHGIGPHEILRLPGGNLAVANGGIRTHPKTGRDKLNLETMQPNLAIFDPEGRLQDRADVPAASHQNSLRHIAAAVDGTVVCGFQWQGDPFDCPPLVSLYTGQGALVPTQMEAAQLYGLDGYIGSVCAAGGGYAASAPRGGLVMRFDAAGRHVGSARAADICGLCAGPDGSAMATDGLGRVYRLDAHGLTRIAQHDLAFDNHLVAL